MNILSKGYTITVTEDEVYTIALALEQARKNSDMVDNIQEENMKRLCKEFAKLIGFDL